MSDIRVGISGWRYVPWRGSFYPKGLVQKQELFFASRAVNSIELNGSFYGLQTPTRYTNWYTDAPDDFIFSVKAPRLITHLKRLNDIEIPVANFFASGVLRFKEKLGPILWQFPPSFKFDKEKFEHFLTLLPHDTHAAFACAKNADLPQKSRDTEKPPHQQLRHAVEIRNESFRNAEFIVLLRKYNIALVVADTANRWPQLEDVTSDFMYMRLHGDAQLYKSGYSEKALEYWFKRIKTWSRGQQPSDAKCVDHHRPLPRKSRDVFCYFDNTEKLWAPHDAREILKKLKLADNLKTEPGKPLAKELVENLNAQYSSH